MSSRTKKQAVLLQLSQEAEPIPLQELLEKLGDNYTERSVRRWLAEMVKEGVIEKQGERKGTRYKVIQRIDRHVETISSCFGVNSKKTIAQVQRPIYERTPVTYADDWIESYQPNISFYIPLEFRQQLYKAGKRSKKEDPAGTYAHQIFNRLLIDLSYNSSRLEGNTYSLLDTQKLILEGATAEGKLDEEKIMILNHKEAIRYLVDTAPKLEVNMQTICTLHYLLSDGLVEARYAGKVRDQGVRIGGSTYIPFEHSEALQNRLTYIFEKAARIDDPYEQSLFLLVHITYLQPFLDVNKRTARLSANIPLIKSNLVPLSFNDVERNDYISAVIAIYELQDIRPILDLYIFSYMRTCAVYDSTVKALGFDIVRVRYRNERRAIIREIVLNCLVGKAIDEYVSSQTLKLVKNEDQKAFLEDIREDLKEIDQSYIVGLGITPNQLQHWMDVRMV
ncbi:MAG: Fic family protein [Chlamydiota bacterium]